MSESVLLPSADAAAAPDHVNEAERERGHSEDAVSQFDRSFLDRASPLALGANAKAYQWFNNGWSPRRIRDELRKCERSASKDGRSFLQGSVKADGGRRTEDAMNLMELIGFDVDYGESPEPIEARARELGIETYIYPTYNHNKPESRVTTDRLMKWVNRQTKRWPKLGPDDEATEEQVLAYFAEDRGYKPWLMETATYRERDGHDYIIDHAPFARFRVILIFKRAVRVDQLSPTLTGAKQKWADGREEVAALLGIKDHDEACNDLNRLFYFHRRAEVADDWFIEVEGNALDPDKIKAFNTKLGAGEEKKNDAPSGDRERRSYLTPGLGAFFARYGKHFNAARFLLDYGEDAVEVNKGVAARCPNEHGCHKSAGHTDEDPQGKRALFALDASDCQHGVASIKCQHQTCKNDLKMPDYVDLICQAHELTVEDLKRYVDEEALDDLPNGFNRHDGFIWKMKPRQGEHPPEEIRICTEFRVIARKRDENSFGWGREVEFRTEDDVTRRQLLDDKLIAGDAADIRKALVDAGMWITTLRWGRDQFSALMNTYTSSRRVVEVSKCGWWGLGDNPVYVTPLGDEVREPSWRSPASQRAD